MRGTWHLSQSDNSLLKYYDFSVHEGEELDDVNLHEKSLLLIRRINVFLNTEYSRGLTKSKMTILFRNCLIWFIELDTRGVKFNIGLSLLIANVTKRLGEQKVLVFHIGDFEYDAEASVWV